MLSPLDRPLVVEALRDGIVHPYTVTLRAYPRVWPKLPGPPPAGTPAPALNLVPYGDNPVPPVGRGAKTLVFFWATWCPHCKAALSELAMLEADGETVIVAVTDEDPATLKRFFAGYRGPFPSVVARDPDRQVFRTYGVSARPTFVWIGADGRIVGDHRGYTKAAGLPAF